MPRFPPAFLLTLIVSVAAPVALGASDAATTAPLAAAPAAPAPDARGMDEAERKAYAAKLRDAQDLVGRKQYAAAIAVLDALSAAHPREPQARFIKGVALADEGQSEAAVAQYRSLVADYPELPEPHNNLAVLYAAKGEYALARDELERAIEAAPDYAIAHRNLGDVYVRLAEIEYRRAVSLDKGSRGAAARLEILKQVEAAGAPAAAH